MKTYADPQLRARLAADYVSGAMRGGARRRFEGLMAADASLRHEVRDWERDLYSIVWAVPPRTPPGRVWRAIRQRIRQKVPTPTRHWSWGGTYLWRSCSAALAVALIAIVAIQPVWMSRPAQPQQVAVLQSSQGQAFLIIRADTSGTMYVSTLENLTQMADGHALELWSMPPGGKPISLGLVATNGLTKLAIPQSASGMKKLGISLEPPGGSPSGLPTGPVVMTGDVLLS